MATPGALILGTGGRLCLGPTGRPVVADASGSASCICGGVGGSGCVPPDPNGCGCSSNPTCTTFPFFRWLQAIGFDGSSQTVTDVYKIPSTCCCGPTGAGYPWRYAYRRTVRVYNAFNTHAPCTIEVSTCSGSGVGPGSYSCTKSGRDLFDCLTTSCSPDISGVLTPGCAPGQPPIDACYPSFPGQVGASGFIYRDCFTYEQRSTSVSSEFGGALMIYDSFSVRMDVGPSAECPTGPACGACCCSGRCFGGLTSSQCVGMGGVFQGTGTHCASINCRAPALPGACCRSGGICQQVLESQCLALGGDYQGDLTICGQLPCPDVSDPRWACCHINPASCSLETRAGCALIEGATWHPNLDCSQVQCAANPPNPGACCRTDGSCVVTTQSACDAQGGYFQGPDTNCSGGCVGGCCHGPRTVHEPPCACTEENILTCLSYVGCGGVGPGLFLGFGASCDPDPCGVIIPPGGVGGGGAMFSDMAERSRSRSYGGFRGGCGSCGSGLVVPSPADVDAVRRTRGR